jgi:alkylation response protein AidB-like acyl-CoA dehydrogenase
MRNGGGSNTFDRDAWRKAGEMGLLLTDVPREYGGANEIMKEIIARAMVDGGKG